MLWGQCCMNAPQHLSISNLIRQSSRWQIETMMHFVLWHVCTVCCDIRPSFSSLCRQYFENATRETSFIGYSSESSALAVSQATLDIKPNYREDQKLDERQYQQVGTVDLNLNDWYYLAFAVLCRWKFCYCYQFC